MKTHCEELQVVHDQLGAYYGKEYMKACHSNEIGTVCERLMHKLDPSPPPKKLVEQYLIEIARAANIDFTPDENAMRDDVGEAPGAIAESELIELYDKSVDPPYNGPKGPGGPGFGGGGGGQMPAPTPFSYPPRATAPGASYMDPDTYSEIPGPTSLPPYTPNDPNQAGGTSYMKPPPDMDEGHQAPPLPHKSPAGLPPVDVYSGADEVSNIPPQSNLQPPRPAPRSASPVVPDLPSVPSSFSTPPPGGPSGGSDVDFDDLTKRFENLKNKK